MPFEAMGIRERHRLDHDTEEPFEYAEEDDEEKPSIPDVGELEEAVREYHALLDEQTPFWDRVSSEYRARSVIDAATEEEGVDNIDDIPSGFVFTMVNTIVSRVWGGDKPKMFFEGADPEDQPRVRVLEAAVNTVINQDPDFDQQMFQVAQDTAKYGVGYGLTEYMPRVSNSGREAEMRRMRILRAESPAEAAALDMVRSEQAERIARGASPNQEMGVELDDRVVTGRISFRRIHPASIIMDPDAVDVDQAWMIGRDVWADLGLARRRWGEDIVAECLATQRDSRWSNRAHYRKMQTRRRPGLLARELFVRDDAGKWQKIVYAAASLKVLQKAHASPYWFGQPYSLNSWNADGDNLFAPSDVVNPWALQAAIRHVLSKVVDGASRKQDDVTFISRELGITQETINGFVNPSIGRVVIANSAHGQRLAEHIFRLPNISNSGDAAAVLNILSQHLQLAGGLSVNDLGGSMKSETSATEAAAAAAGSGSRGSLRGRGMQRFVRQVAMRVSQLMAQFYDRADMMRLVGVELGKDWPEDWTPFSTVQSMRLVVEAGTERAQSGDERLKRLLETLTVISKIPGGFQSVSLPEFLDRIFHEGLGWRKGDPVITIRDPNEAAAAVAAADGSVVGGQEAAPPEPGGTLVPPGGEGLGLV